MVKPQQDKHSYTDKVFGLYSGKTAYSSRLNLICLFTHYSKQFCNLVYKYREQLTSLKTPFLVLFLFLWYHWLRNVGLRIYLSYCYLLNTKGPLQSFSAKMSGPTRDGEQLNHDMLFFRCNPPFTSLVFFKKNWYILSQMSYFQIYRFSVA